ncbi:hypothetical protein HYR99_20215 [Candidatus Poribacteria bacterium]|nr:hypothetical protein [Candidatus Poribacteria bacterium]
MIVEQGQLPSVDTQRWHPIGRASKEQLTLTTDVIAGLYQLVHRFHPQTTIEKTALLYPVIISVLSGPIFFLLIRRLLGTSVALLSLNLLFIMPPVAYRTAAGFAEQDALCLLLAFSTYYFYVCGYQATSLRHRYVYMSLSGVLMGLLGLTWYGVSLMLAPIVCVEWVKYLLKNEASDFKLYLCWASPILMALIGFKTVYHHLTEGYALGTFILLCLPILIRSLHLSLESIPSIQVSNWFENRYRVSFVLTGFASFSLGGMVLWILRSTHTISQASLLESFLAPFGPSRLFRTVEELATHSWETWRIWPGVFFFLFIVGSFLCLRRVAVSLTLNFWDVLILYQILLAGTLFTPLFSNAIRRFHPMLPDWIYGGTLVVFLGGFVCLTWRAFGKDNLNSTRYDKRDQNALFLLAWFLITLFGARTNQRFHFFVVPIACALGSYALISLLEKMTPLPRKLCALTVLIISLCEFLGLKSQRSVWPISKVEFHRLSGSRQMGINLYAKPLRTKENGKTGKRENARSVLRQTPLLGMIAPVNELADNFLILVM